jgi:hypothetical protein
VSILSDILGTGDVVKAGIDLIDDMHTSKEEEIEAKNSAKIRLLEAYGPFKKAQRWLMVLVSINYFIAFWMVMVFALTGNLESKDVVLEVLALFNVGWIMMAIVTFYFGGGLIEGGIGKWKGNAKA